MGSIEAPEERILIVFIRDLPPALIEEIKGEFPGYDLKIHRSDTGIPVPRGTLGSITESTGHRLMNGKQKYGDGRLL